MDDVKETMAMMGETPMKTRLRTYKYADVSTMHVTKEDADLLAVDARIRSGKRDPRIPALIVFGYEEGFFVHVPEDEETFKDGLRMAKRHGYSKGMLKLLRLARDEGASFLRLDADGEPYGGLRTFDW